MSSRLLRNSLSQRATRRRVLSLMPAFAFPSVGLLGKAADAAVESSLAFGLTPVFLTNDLELLTKLKAYLSRKTGRDVQLVQRRTYEEITTLLAAGSLSLGSTP